MAPFYRRLFLWLGALLLAAGVIFFFAYNWQALGRFAKFGLVEGLLAVAVAAAWIAGPDKPPARPRCCWRRSADGRAARAHGPDVSDRRGSVSSCSRWWAVLILPWTDRVRGLPALWLLFVALLNLTVALYFLAFRGVLRSDLRQAASLVWALFALNTARARRVGTRAALGLDWLQDRWAAAPDRGRQRHGGHDPRRVGGLRISQTSASLAITAYVAWLAAAYFYYRHRSTRSVRAGRRRAQRHRVRRRVLSALLCSTGRGRGFLFIGVVVHRRCPPPARGGSSASPAGRRGRE